MNGPCCADACMPDSDKSPAVCLQALCCTCYAALATRWMLQDQMRLHNTWLDDCLTTLTLNVRTGQHCLGCDGSDLEGFSGGLPVSPVDGTSIGSPRLLSSQLPVHALCAQLTVGVALQNTISGGPQGA